MSKAGGDVGWRIERLLRCYPRSWRERYRDGFAELSISDLEERGRDARRSGL
ncbi:MAG TPA: hypothetical protein VHV79_12075 [Mycobacteriales bacterium]|jgi:hypothetical protein|nr:hypothetical protein [Mycobacteriales bacterium]